jgi:photosystem II stability/assembly factor-like uncharacterized protein
MKKVIFGLMLLGSFYLKAQPFQVPSVLENKAPGNTVKYLCGPSSFSNENEGYAFSRSSLNIYDNYGSLVRTTDGGKSWNVTSLQIFSNFGDSRQYESFRKGINLVNPQPNLIYANEYKSEDGGKTWKQTISGAEQVAFFNNFSGLAIKNGKLLTTVNGGIDWTIINETENFSGFRIFFRKSAFRILLLKFSENGQNLICKVSNSSGSGFETYFQSITGNNITLANASVSFFDNDRGLYLDGNFPSAKLYAIGAGGSTFTPYAPSCPAKLTIGGPEVSVFPSGIGYVNGSNSSCVGDPGDATQTIYKTTDFGLTWNALTYDWGNNNYTKMIYAFTESNLITQNGLKSTDGGTTWSNFSGVPYYEYFGSKCGVGDKSFANGAYFAIGDNNQRIITAMVGCDFGGTNVQKTLKTTNNGASWFDYEPAASYPLMTNPIAHYGVEAPLKTPNGNHYMFRGVKGFKLNSSGLFFSTDFGATWVLSSSLVKLNPWYFSTVTGENTCLFYNPSTNELMHVDGESGVRTIAKKMDGTDLPVLSPISFSDEDNGIGFNGKTLFKTTNGGKNWAEMGDLPNDLLQSSFNLIGPGKLGPNGQVFYFSRKRMSQASNLEGNNTLYKINIPASYTPILSYSVAQIFGSTSTSELSSYIGSGSMDMVGDKGVVATCDGSLFETEDAWTTVRKITASDFCQGLIARPVKSVLVGSNVYHFAANFNDNISNCSLVAFRSGEKTASGFFDGDGDGFRGTAVVYNNFLPPSSPTLLQIGGFQDCDDNEPAISPVAPDNICDGIDNNCNGTVDEGATFVLYWKDLDGDGFGDPSTGEQFCTNPGASWVTNGSDCNDADILIRAPLLWNLDTDGDGYGDPGVFIEACEDPSTAFAHYVRNGADCNDSNPLEFNAIWFLDADQDGFGTESVVAGMVPENVVFSCSNPSTDDVKYVRNRRDCDDADPLISPRQFEINTDGIDNDCDGSVDEGVDPPGTTYCDIDGDGFGDPGCPIPPAGRLVQKNGQAVFITSSEGVENNTDCDDANPLVNPASFELANGKDNDCNGLVSDTLEIVAGTWFQDADGDGFGNGQQSITSISQPPGYVANGEDCDDSDFMINPLTVWIQDADQDGYGTGLTLQQCAQPVGYRLASQMVQTFGDCNDNNPAINPGAPEICGNQLDDNCNGQTDENNPIVNAGPDQVLNQNSGQIQLTGTPAGGSWSGTGVSATGLFNTAQATGPYTLTYSIGGPCPGSDQVVITLQSGAGGSLTPPTFSPAGGTFANTQMVTLSSSDPLATIYYTLTGNTPLLTPWPNSFTKIYSGPIQVIKNTQIKAIAVRPGFSNSSVAVSTYTIIEGLVVENPVISPGTGTYPGSQLVSISTQTPGATIYYTTNGNTPLLTTPNSFTKLYEGPFLINQSSPIKAMAVKSGLQNSGVTTVNLTISDPAICAPPVILPGSGSYSGAQTIVLSTTTVGATILYTTNGNIPVSGTSFTKVYSQPFVINATATIRAIATKPGFENSTCPRADVVITSPSQTVATPVISPGTGTFASAQLVSLSCATPGATIYYTTNGNVPRLDVPNGFTKTYSGPFTVSTSATIRAIATAPDRLNSPTAVAYLTIGGAARKAGSTLPDSDPSKVDFVVVPNPNQGKFQVVDRLGKQAESRKVEVFSFTGQKIWEGNWEEKTTGLDVDLQGLSPGIYSIRIIGNSSQKLIRFQKQ